MEHTLQSPERAAYRVLDPCTLLAPVPAVLVSCRSGNGPANALAVAWAGTVCSHPPMVSISLKQARHSYGLIRESGEFVVNLVDAAHVRALDYCGVRSGRDGDKLAACGLTPAEMPGMDLAPALAGFLAHLGCKVRQVIPLGSHDLFLAEIVSVRVREDLFDEDGSMHLERADLAVYSHGVYQRAAEPLGFFGWSIARPDILEKRMSRLRKG